jgi:DNA-binding beta-propeller fold protein YncE
MQYWIILLAMTSLALAQANEPLHLDQIVPLPDVQGRIDHLSIDKRNNRLFVAALGNHTVEVIDIPQGKRIGTIRGLPEPQGVLYRIDGNRLYVANRADGTLRIFDAGTDEPLQTVNLGDNADNIRFDNAKQQLYVGYGNGALAILDTKGTKLADIRLDAHPESFQLEKNGPRLFVNLPKARRIAVVDRGTKSVIAQWETEGALSNYPMALDEEHHRLFVVCRVPAQLLVLDTRNGTILQKLPVVGDSDDVFYDASRQRVYATGGEGRISVFQQDDPDHYRPLAEIATVKGARTSTFYPEHKKFFVAVPRQGSEPAAIRIYSVR